MHLAKCQLRLAHLTWSHVLLFAIEIRQKVSIAMEKLWQKLERKHSYLPTEPREQYRNEGAVQEALA
jgi:hypothetical protein